MPDITNKRSSPRARSTPPDWLPNVRPGGTSANIKVIRKGKVQERKDSDWFLALGAAMEQRDAVQSRLFTKFYFFLRDFIPQGLGDDKFGHIDGNDVMDQLLSHPNESTASRHKLTKYANDAFRDLQNWMGSYVNWQQAVKKAKSDAEADRTRANKKRAQAWKAPGLHTPAAILAILIIAHPDAKFKDWIGQLQIEWMVTQSRETLDVQQGFWDGLNSRNLDDVFVVNEEPRRAEGHRLADYSQLFGPRFTSCRRDIRPFAEAFVLQPLTGELSDLDEDDDELELGLPLASPTKPHATVATSDVSHVSSGTSEIPTPEHSLRSCLDVSARSPKRELSKWLLRSLTCDWKIPCDNDGKAVLSAWCEHWEEEINQADSYQSQVTTRELFFSSLQRLRALEATPWLVPYMLSEMQDRGSPYTEEDLQKARSVLQDLPEFQAYCRASEQLHNLVEMTAPTPTVRDRMTVLSNQQVVSFCRFTKGSFFFNFWRALFAYETLHIHMIVRGYQTPVMDDLLFWRSKRDILLSQKVCDTLELRSSQMLALLLPGAFNILTDNQARIFRQQFCPELDTDPVDSFREGPRRVSSDDVLPESVQMRHKSLYKLIGDLQGLEDGTCASRASSQHPPGTGSTQTPMPVPAVQRRPSQASSGRDLSPSRDSTRKNRFAGRSHFVSKRACSPAVDERATKVPRLGFITRDEVAGEMQALKREITSGLEQLRADLPAADSVKTSKAEVICGLEQVKNEINNNLGQLSTDLGSGLERLQTEISSGVDHARQQCAEDVQQAFDTATGKVLLAISEKHDKLAGLLDVKDSVSHLVTAQTDVLLENVVGKSEVAAIVQGAAHAFATQTDVIVEKVVERLNVGAIVQEAVAAHTEVLLQKITALQPWAPLEIGQDGYLAAHCPAPPNWELNQKAYVSELINAAWLYIRTLGSPDGGCFEDESALELVETTYPLLNEDHLELALQHVHLQIYGNRLGVSK